MADDLGVQNVMRGTAEYVLQVGHVHGNVHVYLPPDADPVERAAQALARSVRAQWTAELNAWDLATAEPLPVRWLASWPDPPGSHDPPDPPGSPNPPDPPGSPDSPNPSDPPDSPGSPGSPDDRIATVADAFLGLGHRRLVVLGGPGAGKSTFAVLLALELADRSLPPHRTPPDADDMARPVPVVLTLESWDPRQEHFHTWLARRIAEEHPGLPRIDGSHPAARLIQERRVVPVLDGLDELPEHRRPLVVQGIDRDLGRHDAVVLASRTREYRAGEAAGAAVARAAVIEAQPVGLADATAYLLASAVPQLRREWKLLLDAADREPDGPVALALSSPLMIWLARRGLRTPPSDPLELLRLPSPTRDSVERHLLDLILPAVFTEQPHAPDRLHAPGQWSADRARHWLRYLARHLTNLRTTELSWWDLHRATLVRTLALPTLLLVCVALSGIYGAASDWFAAERAAGQPFGGWPSLTSLTLQSALTGGMLFGMVVWLAVENWFGFRRGMPRRRANPFKIGAALRSAGRGASVRRAAKAAAVIVVPTAIFGAITLSVADPRPYLVMLLCSTVLAPLLMVAIAAPSDTEDASTPDEVLRGERTAALLSLATVAVLIGLGQGAHGWLQEGGDDMGWAKAVAGWFGASVMLLLMSQWSRWLLAKGWLATVGRVPWSLMEFLRDAHRGGLLQRSGGVYRFRHLRLQEHLADRIASAAPVVAPAGPLREPLVRHGQPPPRTAHGPGGSRAHIPGPARRIRADAALRAQGLDGPLGRARVPGRGQGAPVPPRPLAADPALHDDACHPHHHDGQLGRGAVPDGRVDLPRAADHVGVLAASAPTVAGGDDPGAHRVRDGSATWADGVVRCPGHRSAEARAPEVGHQGVRAPAPSSARRTAARAVLPVRRRLVPRHGPRHGRHGPVGPGGRSGAFRGRTLAATGQHRGADGAQ
ncbi:NACHT domain-containing protein [Streptomyces sp. NPDC020965]|uniref:NACHT domain-containing protein n=1 Tax=Streptomyces sp. NPDC020965 TaxID=3365105 RepID=UPI0037BC0FAD